MKLLFNENLVDYDKNLNLEFNSFFKKTINLILIPILNNLPRNFKNKIKKTDKAASEVIDNATNHNALEILYKSGSNHRSESLVNKFFKYVWFNINNSKAVRNRLKFVRRELKSHLEKISKIDKEINIISIASGSSRAIIETINEGHYLKDTKLSLTFLDKNPLAIQYSKNLASSISHKFINLSWIEDTVGNFLNNNKNIKKYDIVEIVGLLDYFDDNKVLDTFKGIYSILDDGGIVITANINHNSEEKFITNVIDWKMIYRDVNHLSDIIAKAGFVHNKMRSYYEPLKIHGLVVAQK